MRCTMNCGGGKKLRKRKRGPMRGMYVCPRCGPIAPRAMALAYRWQIPVDLWVLIHRRAVDDRDMMERIGPQMIADYRAGKLNEVIAAERDRRIGKYDPADMEDFEMPATSPRPKVTWRSTGEICEAS